MSVRFEPCTVIVPDDPRAPEFGLMLVIEGVPVWIAIAVIPNSIYWTV